MLNFGLWASKGMVQVPDLSGLSTSAAIIAIQNAHLVAIDGGSTSTSNSGLNGQVASQLPNSGDLVDHETGVSYIYYSYVAPPPPPPDPPQNSSISGISISGTTCTITGSFPQNATNIAVNNVNIGSWSYTSSSLSFDVSSYSAGTLTVQVYNGRVPLLAQQSVYWGGSGGGPTPTPTNYYRASTCCVVSGVYQLAYGDSNVDCAAAQDNSQAACEGMGGTIGGTTVCSYGSTYPTIPSCVAPTPNPDPTPNPNPDPTPTPSGCTTTSPCSGTTDCCPYGQGIENCTTDTGAAGTRTYCITPNGCINLYGTCTATSTPDPGPSNPNPGPSNPGTCTDTTWTNNGTYECFGIDFYVQQTSNCGNTRWVVDIPFGCV